MITNNNYNPFPTPSIEEILKTIKEFQSLPPLIEEILTPLRPTLFGEDIIELYNFSKRAGMTFPEACIFFIGDTLLMAPGISNETIRLAGDILYERTNAGSSMDKIDKKLHNIIAELSDILFMESLGKDLYWVPTK